MRRVRVTTVAVEKQYVLHNLTASAVLFIRHAKRMRRIIFSPFACWALPYFSTLSHKRRIFGGENLMNIKCVSSFYLLLLCEPFLILRRIRGHIIINERRFSRKAPITLVTF